LTIARWRFGVVSTVSWDRGMFSRLGDEELIQAKMQKIARIDIQVCPSKRANPKVEQREVS
jgi:hypothetical protein